MWKRIRNHHGIGTGTGTGTVQHSIIGHFLGAYCVLYNVQYNIWVSHAPTVEPERQLIIQEVIIIIP